METTLQEIENAIIASEDAKKKIYEVNLIQEFHVPMFGTTKKLKCRFFISTGGLLCIQPLRRKRSGFRAGLLIQSIASIKELGEPIKKEYDVLQNAKTLLKKMHPNAWDELRERLQSAVDTNDASKLQSEYMLHGKVKYRNIVKDIEKYNGYSKTQILNAITKAFENKESYRWSHNTNGGGGRDLSLSVEPKEDGILRAYFSSEFMGCGNGDYYLLINPTTAIFNERD